MEDFRKGAGDKRTEQQRKWTGWRLYSCDNC